MLRYLLRVYGPILLLLLGLLAATSLSAQEARLESNWANLKQVSPGDDVRVTLMDGKSLAGKFQTYSDNAIGIRTITGEQTLSQADVFRISAKGKSHRLRNALIGAAIAAAAGAAALGAGGENREVIPGGAGGAAIGAAAFAPLGLAVGALMPTGQWREVYRAR